MTVLSAQLTSAMRCGERPVTKAPFSDSAAARVARPKRVNRNHSVSTIDTTMMTAVNQSRSPGTRLPSMSYTWYGKIGVTETTDEPIPVASSAPITTMTPTEATAFAAAGAARSGRKISTYSSAPSTPAMTIEIPNEGQNPSGPVPMLGVGLSPGIGSTSFPCRRNA
jgi:hypothetical protein